jgi:hypothetical protein
MVIGEALSKIKDLEAKRNYIYGRTVQTVFVLPEEKEEGKTIENTLDEYKGVCSEIAELKNRVIATNVATRIRLGIDRPNIPEEANLLGILKLIEKLRMYEQITTTIVGSINNRGSRFFSGSYGEKDAIKLEPNFVGNAQLFIKQAEEYKETARELEKVLVKANWQTELL